ncbi:MAG: response regulator [Gammaproteobacteria bacterium]|nr:response regulator [Gammaproteobacteria bacterium]
MYNFDARRLLLVGLGLILTLLWSGSLYEIRRSTAETLTDARAASEFQAQAFAENTLSSIKRLNELLLDLRSNWTGDWDRFSDTVLTRQKHIADISLQVAVIGADGMLLYSNLAKASKRVDLSSRVHYRVHAQDPQADRLYISEPVKGKVSGRWSIQFTRPIFVEQTFAGVLVISVSPDIFASFHQKLKLGDNGVTTLINAQGRILARYPNNEQNLGKEVTGDFLNASGPVSGSFHRSSQVDGIDRIVGYYRLPDYGLTFLAGSSVDELMGAQRRHRDLVLASSTLVTVVLVVLGVLLQRVISARETAGRMLHHAQDQQRMLSAAVHQTHALVLVTQHDGRVVFVNDAFTRTTGHPRDSILGQDLCTLTAASDPSNVLEALCKHISTAQPWEGELHGRRADGEEYWISGTITPVFDERQQITHFVSVQEDITDRKHQQVELIHAKDRAEAANIAKGQFLANMSHEIRTPLNGVIGSARIGLRESAHQPDLGRRFKQILESGSHLLALIEDILDFSRIDANRLKTERIPMHLDQVVDTAVHTLEAEFQAKRIALEVRKDGLEHATLGDPLRIGQILLNLLSNALKFTDRGTVQLQALWSDQLFTLVVGDSGIGMTPEQLQRVWSPFEQADASSTRKYGGAGLGLSITRRIIELMDGTIDVDTQLGQGTTFTVRLPMPPASGEAARVPEDDSVSVPASGDTSSGAELSGLRLLLVEDDPVNQLVMEDILGSAGAEFSTVSDGEEAVRLVAEPGRPRFHAILMDLQMPGMNGHEATRHIHERLPGLPVIGQTAHAFADELQTCMESGMVACITKPIDPLLLVHTVRQHALSAAI